MSAKKSSSKKSTKKNNGRDEHTFFIGGLLVATGFAVIFGVVTYAALIGATSRPVDKAREFAAGIVSNDFDQVYGTFSDDLRAEISKERVMNALSSDVYDHTCEFVVEDRLATVADDQESHVVRGNIECEDTITPVGVVLKEGRFGVLEVTGYKVREVKTY